MKNIIFICLGILILSAAQVYAGDSVTVREVRGDVKFRKGLEESWQPVLPGMLLEEIDTILSGEGAAIELELNNGRQFHLGENSMLDIGDLRNVIEKELFLYIMSKKIDAIAPTDKKTKIRIGTVSVVHGNKVTTDSAESVAGKEEWYIREKNGGLALFQNELYPNTIMKMYKLMTQYDTLSECGELYFYMGKSFEKMEKNGQAIDYYQQAIDQNKQKDCSGSYHKQWVSEAKQALSRLKTE